MWHIGDGDVAGGVDAVVRGGEPPHTEDSRGMYGTLGQNKLGDVVTENTQTNKRTSSENFSSRYKAHLVYTVTKNFRKKVLF